MPNALTIVTNQTANPLPLPYPYKGMVFGDAQQAAYLADSPATVLANLGGASAVQGIWNIAAVPTGSTIPVTYHDQSQQPTSGVQLANPTSAQQPATKAYVDSAVVTPGAAAGGDLAGTYPNPTIAPGAIDSDDFAANAVNGPALSAGAMRFLTSQGHNGAGAATLTGAKVGDTVVGVSNVTDHVTASASFEATITVADQIQQSSATDLSAKTITVLLVAKS